MLLLFLLATLSASPLPRTVVEAVFNFDEGSGKIVLSDGLVFLTKTDTLSSHYLEDMAHDLPIGAEVGINLQLRTAGYRLYALDNTESSAWLVGIGQGIKSQLPYIVTLDNQSGPFSKHYVLTLSDGTIWEVKGRWSNGLREWKVNDRILYSKKKTVAEKWTVMNVDARYLPYDYRGAQQATFIGSQEPVLEEEQQSL